MEKRGVNTRAFMHFRVINQSTTAAGITVNEDKITCSKKELLLFRQKCQMTPELGAFVSVHYLYPCKCALIAALIACFYIFCKLRPIKMFEQ